MVSETAKSFSARPKQIAAGPSGGLTTGTSKAGIGHLVVSGVPPRVSTTVQLLRRTASPARMKMWYFQLFRINEPKQVSKLSTSRIQVLSSYTAHG